MLQLSCSLFFHPFLFSALYTANALFTLSILIFVIFCSRLIYIMYVAVVHELEPTTDQSPEEGQLSLEVSDWFWCYSCVVINYILALSIVQSTVQPTFNRVGPIMMICADKVSLFANIRSESRFHFFYIRYKRVLCGSTVRNCPYLPSGL